MNEPTAPALGRRPDFRAYLASTAFATLAFSMQQLLVSWLLVGILLLPGDAVGLVQGAIGIPGIALMLWGGASADRTDPRRLLIRVYALAPLVPLALWSATRLRGLDLPTVVAWGLAMAVVMAFSSPGQAALLSRVSASSIQRGVTAATAPAVIAAGTGLPTTRRPVMLPRNVLPTICGAERVDSRATVPMNSGLRPLCW